jgi:DNA-binding response OmpR family regulator
MTGGMRVLVVEDDPDIASLLRRNFEAEGMTADHAADGDTALQLARHRPYHAIVLDVMLPGKSGIEVCQLLRKHSDAATIIMLSARDTVNDRVEGLAAGADDYLVKPFAFEELLARIRAQQRRRALESQIVADETIRSGKLSFDPSTITLSGFGKTATLTDREADLLLYFFRNEGLPISRDQIFDALWQGQGGVALNVVDVYVGYLRRKLASLSPQARDALSTVRGKGFRYVPPAGTGQG